MTISPDCLFDFKTASTDEAIEYVESQIPLLANKINAMLPCQSTDIKCGESMFTSNERLIALTIETPQFIIDRCIDLDKQAATPGSFSLSKNDRNRGLGKKLMFAHLEGLRDIGLSRCNIFAGSSNGAYTWVNFGFEFVRNGHVQQYDNMDVRIDLLEKFFHIDRLQEFNQVARPSSSADLKSLIKFKTSLESLRPETKQEFVEYLAKADETDPYHHAKEYLKDSLNSIMAKYGSFSMEDFPFGEFIIQGLGWYGYFDLHDDRQWQTAHAATFPELAAR